MTPKSLLRHPLARSETEDFVGESHFRRIMSDRTPPPDDKIRKLVLCSGKVGYDLMEARDAAGLDDVTVVRIEQLYPFPGEPLVERLKTMPNHEDVVWCQEEPQNQGAWYCSQHNFRAAIPAGADLKYAGRPASASPAVGYMSVHLKQQKALVDDALNIA